MSSSHTVSNYKISTMPNNNYHATYTITLPPSHCANGTNNDIIQKCRCQISFNNQPAILLRSKLISINHPERFGPYSTHEERIQYLYNFVHDTATNSAA